MIILKNLGKSIIRSAPLPYWLKEKLLFFLKLRYWPNFTSPQSLSEKLHYRKYHERDQRMVKLSDKIAVRDFVASRVGSDYLIPLLHSVEDLSPDLLMKIGKPCVIKRNDDSGSACIVDGSNLTLKEAARICDELRSIGNYADKTNEWWYRDIDRKILIEEKIGGGGTPIDYKFFVFEGKSFFIETIRRLDDGSIECGFFDQNLKPLTYNGSMVQFRGCRPFTGEFPVPDLFSEMCDVALKLSEGLNFVRVDLYAEQGRVFFGELTFCPSEGRSCITPIEFDYELGRWWSGPLLIQRAQRKLAVSSD